MLELLNRERIASHIDLIDEVNTIIKFVNNLASGNVSDAEASAQQSPETKAALAEIGATLGELQAAVGKLSKPSNRRK